MTQSSPAETLAFVRGLTDAYAQAHRDLSADEKHRVRARVRSILSSMLPSYFANDGSSGQSGPGARPAATTPPQAHDDGLLGAMADFFAADPRPKNSVSPLHQSETEDDDECFDPLFGLGAA